MTGLTQNPTSVIMLQRIMAAAGLVLLLVALSAHHTTAEISTTNFIVNSYTVALTVPDTATAGSTLNTAQVVISLTCRSATAPIVLNWGPSLLPASPTITNITVTKTSTATAVVITVATDTTKQIVTLTPDASTPLVVDDAVTVTIKYQINVNAEARGVFMLSFPDGNQTSSFLGTNAWPLSARDISPCVDQPSVATPWSITLTRPTAWNLVSSLPSTDSTASTTGTTTDTLATATGVTLPSSSLSIFLSGNLQKTPYTDSTTSTTFNFWTRSGLVGSTDLNNTMSKLGQLFLTVDKTINSKLTSLDVVLVPNLPEPLSSPGIIYIREDVYNVTSAGQVRSVVMPVVSHYIKQYTLFRTRPATWADYWVSEALGGFLEYSVLASTYPDLDLATELKVVVRQSALAIESMASSSPLHDSSIDTDSPSAIQSAITDPLKKLKGTALLNMLDMSLPAGSILTAIAALLVTGTAVTTDEVLTGLATSLATSTLTTQQTALVNGVSTWVNSAGFPLVTVSVTNYGTPANISLQLSSADAAYVVPTTVGSKSDTRYSAPRQDLIVVTKDGLNVNCSANTGDWIASNMQSTGYYRVNYDSANWQLLKSALASNYSQIPGFSQILDDSMALASSGLVTYSDALSVASANFKYPQFENWYSIYTNLWRLRDNLLDTNYYSFFEDYARQVLQDASALLQGTTATSAAKEKILALVFEGLCDLNIGNYRTQAVNSLSSLLQGNPVSVVESSAYDALVCCGAQYSTSVNATALRTTLSDSAVSFYARRYNAIALGCLSNYSDISTQLSALQSASASDIQIKPLIFTALEQVVEKHPKEFIDNLGSSIVNLQTLLGAPQTASLIVKVGQKINSATYSAKLTTIASSTSITLDATVAKALRQSVAEVALKVTWLEKNNATVTAALKSNTAASSGVTLQTVFSLSCMLPIVIYMFKTVVA